MMIVQENMHYAKTHFSELVKRALAGDQVVIAKAGKPLVELVPFKEKNAVRKPGSAIGSFQISDDFDTPLSSDDLEDWGL